MTNVKRFIAVCVVFLPLLASPIGRTGNGKMTSLEDGFTTTIPTQFPQVSENPDKSVRLENPNAPFGGTEAPSILFAHRFAVFYPTRGEMDRDTLKLEFASNGWTESSLKQDACIDLYYSDRGSATAVVAVWGIGKGVVFVGPKTGMTTNGINQMLSDLVLDAGACAWK